MTGHIGTNTPKFVPPRWGRLRVDPTQTGLCKFGCGLELADMLALVFAAPTTQYQVSQSSGAKELRPQQLTVKHQDLSDSLLGTRALAWNVHQFKGQKGHTKAKNSHELYQSTRQFTQNQEELLEDHDLLRSKSFSTWSSSFTSLVALFR